MTFPPHCTHKLQPLDVGIYGPLKSYYNAECDSWMMRHPGKTISIYEVSSLSTIAMLKTFTPLNIRNAFKKTGIFPFNSHIFSEEDFLMSAVTNRPDPNLITTDTLVIPVTLSHETSSSQVEVNHDKINLAPSTSPKEIIEKENIVSPVKVRPSAKAAPRKQKSKIS